METLQALNIAFLVLGAYSLELFGIEFVNCPSDHRDTLIYALDTGSSNSKCVQMCANRPWCEAALFDRQFFMCHAVLAEDPVLSGTETHPHDNGTTCLLLRKDKFVDGLKQVNIHNVPTFCSIVCNCFLFIRLKTWLMFSIKILFSYITHHTEISLKCRAFTILHQHYYQQNWQSMGNLFHEQNSSCNLFN